METNLNYCTIHLEIFHHLQSVAKCNISEYQIAIQCPFSNNPLPSPASSYFINESKQQRESPETVNYSHVSCSP